MPITLSITANNLIHYCHVSFLFLYPPFRSRPEGIRTPWQWPYMEHPAPITRKTFLIHGYCGYSWEASISWRDHETWIACFASFVILLLTVQYPNVQYVNVEERQNVPDVHKLCILCESFTVLYISSVCLDPAWAWRGTAISCWRSHQLSEELCAPQVQECCAACCQGVLHRFSYLPNSDCHCATCGSPG